MANLKEIEKLVSVKYEDLSGVVKFDLKDNLSSLYDFCERRNICLKHKFLIGFWLEDESMSEITGKNIALSILYIKNDADLSYDKIRSELEEKGSVEVYKESLYIDLSELLAIIKRLDLMVTTTMTDDLKVTIKS